MALVVAAYFAHPEGRVGIDVRSKASNLGSCGGPAADAGSWGLNRRAGSVAARVRGTRDRHPFLSAECALELAAPVIFVIGNPCSFLAWRLNLFDISKGTS